MSENIFRLVIGLADSLDKLVNSWESVIDHRKIDTDLFWESFVHAIFTKAEVRYEGMKVWRNTIL